MSYDVRFIQRIQSINDESFEQIFMKNKQPVIIENAVRHWNALQSWHPAYFADIIPNNEVLLIMSDSNFFSYSSKANCIIKKNRMKMSEATSLILNEIDPKCKYYIPHHPLEGITEIINDFDLPNCANANEIYQKYLWFGQAGNISALHFDLPNNLLVQIYGSKYIQLFAPEERKYLYPTLDPHATYSFINDIDNPDFQRFPHFKFAKKQTGTINPGELIFIPSGWWHQIHSLDTAISINFWWKPKLHECNPGHILSSTAYELYKTGNFSALNENLNLNEFPDFLAVAEYLNERGPKWLTILFCAGFLSEKIKKFSPDSHLSLANSVFQIQIFNENELDFFRNFLPLVEETKFETDDIFAMIDIRNIIENINLIVEKMEKAFSDIVVTI